MSPRFIFRNVSTQFFQRTFSAAAAHPFHVSASTFINVNDRIPDIEVMEDSPGNKISIGKELKGKKAILLGVPAAFSPGCSTSHIPGYISADRKIPIYVIAVNDPFVTKAWGESLQGSKEAGIRFLADPALKLTNALDLAFDGTAIFGGPRSKRYALIVDDGKVLKTFIEPDNTGIKVSAAENVLREW
ncbi:peroxiredoxin [Morchella conica CCBAS932]|uniref:Peroxiredoxin n=1 Tax=Morchella conica CCBAS932 TaxID=1392247 RepID=A0A3N4LIL0_9PEZI|nr:peroxiredoxin [Morchella conica CCBAS932]